MKVDTFFPYHPQIYIEKCTKKTDCSFKLAKQSTFERFSFACILQNTHSFTRKLSSRWSCIVDTLRCKKFEDLQNDVVQMKEIFQNLLSANIVCVCSSARALAASDVLKYDFCSNNLTYTSISLYKYSIYYLHLTLFVYPFVNCASVCVCVCLHPKDE